MVLTQDNYDNHDDVFANTLQGTAGAAISHDFI